jgi:hypothetical protein
MPRFPAVATAALALAAFSTSFAQAELVLPRISPKSSLTQTIGLTDFTLTYSRPGVKGRAIWGGLVPYDKPWRTGANEATSLTVTDPITFGGQKLPAGTYSLYTLPTANEWTVVLNSEKHLVGSVDYKSDKDVLKIQVRPTQTADHAEWLQFGFENLTPNSGELTMRWEKLRVAVPIQVEVNEKALAGARAEMAALKADDWRTPYRAADFAFTNEVALAEGQQWLKKSLTIQENYSNLTLLAKWQMKEGKKKEAIASAKKAIAAGKASKEPVDTTATEKLLAEWSGEPAKKS